MALRTNPAQRPEGAVPCVRETARPAREAPRGFCAAPWTEGVLEQAGTFHVCCRNTRSFGDWIRDGVEACWRSDALQAFRGEILEGRYPDDACRNCHANGTARSLEADLGSAFFAHAGTLARALRRQLPELAAILPALRSNEADGDAGLVLGRFQRSLDGVQAEVGSEGASALAVQKLGVIGRIARSFLFGDRTPPEIAPYRQVSLSDRCNARCIQCPGLHHGDLEAGKVLPDQHLDAAFAASASMVDFFMNGAEFLLYPGWKRVAHGLAREGISLSVSTNGILLTPANIAYLVDHRLARSINVSIDGATRETVESTRVNVKFDRLCEGIARLIAYVDAHGADVALSFSFVLMRRNSREFPEMIRLVDRLRAGHERPRIAAYCQALEGYDLPTYNAFVRREHHSTVPRPELVATFQEALAASRDTGIPVNAFYSHPLPRFVEEGCPFPPLPDHVAEPAGERLTG